LHACLKKGVFRSFPSTKHISVYTVSKFARQAEEWRVKLVRDGANNFVRSVAFLEYRFAISVIHISSRFIEGDLYQWVLKALCRLKMGEVWAGKRKRRTTKLMSGNA
jgi:hypothetical protein